MKLLRSKSWKSHRCKIHVQREGRVALCGKTIRDTGRDPDSIPENLPLLRDPGQGCWHCYKAQKKLEAAK